MLGRVLRLLSPRREENPGRALAQIKAKNDRARIRAKADEMRASMGLPKAEWPAL